MDGPLAEREVMGRGPDPARLISAVVAEWLKRDQAGNRSLNEVERVVRREVLPVWGTRPIEDIRKRDIIALIDGIAATAAPRSRPIARSPMSSGCSAGRQRETSLMAIRRRTSRSRPAWTRRDRVLTDGELAIIWGAVGTEGFPFGPAVQLLVLTAARREEILGLSWREVDLNSAAIRLPAERAKNKEGRVIPLSSAALSVLEELPRFVGGILSSGRVVRHPSPASATPRRGSTTRLPKVKASRCQPGGCTTSAGQSPRACNGSARV